MSNKQAFYEACCNGNHIQELIDALADTKADPIDCYSWKITPSEWRLAIKSALEWNIRQLEQKSPD
jgi:hypothetical protein